MLDSLEKLIVLAEQGGPLLLDEVAVVLLRRQQGQVSSPSMPQPFLHGSDLFSASLARHAV